MKIKKKNLKLIVIGIVILSTLIGSISYLTTKENPATSELAQCLTDNGFTMYGVYWCGHCDDQKKLFGNSFKYIDYVECDERGDTPQPERCRIEGITGYPTWKINGQTLSGSRSLKQLAEVAECEYEL